MKAGTNKLGTEGQMQIFVPGKGKGFKDIQVKQKGVWVNDPTKFNEAKAEIDAWRKANDQKAPKELAGGRIKVGGEVKIDGKDPTKKPKSPLEAFSDKVRGAKEGAGSKVSALSSFVDSFRGKKE